MKFFDRLARNSQINCAVLSRVRSVFHAPSATRSYLQYATRLEREHQRAVKTVLPERNGPLERSSKQIECSRKKTERTTKRNVTIQNTSGTFC
jgi:hypothetical protein